MLVNTVPIYAVSISTDLLPAVRPGTLRGDIVVEFSVVNPESGIPCKRLIVFPFFVSVKVEIPVDGKHARILEPTAR